ncbi:MAG: hypothetical protein M3N13_10210, partial [Candidatus Eremiobacteraeota bacterium]|nr:hypothetical protein [Candidatus Eremiobacteraeota bacterium]
SGAMAVRSQSIHTNLTSEDWRPVNVGGEDGNVAPNPLEPGHIFGGSDTVTYEDFDTGSDQNIDPTIKFPDKVWRHTWTLPLVVSPLDKHALYTSRQQIFRSRDEGKSWTIVSPDLTRGGDENHPATLDPATIADSGGLARRGVVYAIAPSSLRANLLWAGTDDGFVWKTEDGGVRWINVTPPQLSAWSKVGIIEASHFDRARAYIAVDRHRLDDYKPYIYRTANGGKTWTAIADGIPDGSFVNAVREDPKTAGLLYAATERGMYVSFDDGTHWQSLQRNLPLTSVRDIDVHGDDLVIATHGRAFWIMDDITPLRQMQHANASAYLFAPQLTYRVRRAGGGGFNNLSDEGTPIQLDEPQAPNSPAGLIVDYNLREAASTPVVLEIADGGGHVVRSYSSADHPHLTDPATVDISPPWITREPVVSAEPGAHRFVWDFHAKSPDGPMTPPGTYIVRLHVNGSTYAQTATIVRDPRVRATDSDLRAQYDFASAIEAKLAQIESAQRRAKSLKLTNAQRETLIAASRVPDPDDSVGKPPQDFVSLNYLANAYGNLEAAVESDDGAPTADMRSGFAKLNATLARTIQKLNTING